MTIDSDIHGESAFSLVWVSGLVLLMSVTGPLWLFPFRDPDPLSLPYVGWFGIDFWIARSLHGIGVLVLVLSLVGVATTTLRFGQKRRRAVGWIGVAAGLLLMVAVDQHRLQPWVYQSVLYAVMLAALPWRSARRWIMAIAISIYFFSAAGKFDYQFVHTVGSDIVRGMAGLLGVGPDVLSETVASRLTFCLPCGELLVALLLMIRRTRVWGGWAAIGLHATLVILLGPRGFDHSHGVLVWNVLLAVQAWLLFVRGDSKRPDASLNEDQSNAIHRPVVSVFVRSFALAAMVLPLTERLGYWDHWTSWALYSPHTSRVDV
ncbi:MAG: hypothetical protein AAF745_12210, partial [Planctomycetota bacterium]